MTKTLLKTFLIFGTLCFMITGCEKKEEDSTETPIAATPLKVTYVASNVTLKGGHDGKIDVTASGGTKPYTYSWYHGPVKEDLIDLKAGKYAVTVTDGAKASLKIYVTITEPEKYPQLGCKGLTSITDSRDGKTYKVVEIGNAECKQCWMAENLNIGTMVMDYEAGEPHRVTAGVDGVIAKYCNDNNPDTCAKYGGLYDWWSMIHDRQTNSIDPTEIKGICPTGWHLPTDEEWTILSNYVNGQHPDKVGTALKSKTDWFESKNGTDELGFKALPGGLRGTNGGFSLPGKNAYFWSSTETSGSTAWPREIYYGGPELNRFQSAGYKIRGMSVRCVKDSAYE